MTTRELQVRKPYELASYRLGALLDAKQDFRITDDEWAHHALIVGGTGSGKSKLLELIGRRFMQSGMGFCYIDAQGDTAEDLLAYAAYKKNVEGDDSLWKRIHYLEPSYEMVFGYDPFKFQPLHHIADDKQEAAYESWLHTKVDQVSEIIQRKQNQMGFEGMPRLQRILRDVLYATGRAVDEHGRHLPLADCLVLLDLQHPRHEEVFNRVARFLPREILADFEILHGFKRVEDLRRETESTVNRLRSMFGPVMKGIFSETVHTIDFFKIMQEGGILLINLRETDYFSADQANAIGGLFIHELLSTARNTPRELRREFTLIIDEAGEFIGQDLLRALKQVRKYLLRIILAGQDLSTFVKGDVDMTPTVLSQPGTVICFQQTYKKDLEILADRLGRGNLDFEELFTVMDRPDGQEFMDMTDYSENFTWQDGWTQGGSFTHTDTKGLTKSKQLSMQKNWSSGQSHMEGAGNVNTASRANAVVVGPDGAVRSTTANAAASRAQSRNHADTNSQTQGGGITEAEGTAENVGAADAVGLSYGKSGGNGYGMSIARRKQMIQKFREEWHPTGRLRRSVEDQLQLMMTQIYCLDPRQCIVKLKSQHRSFPVCVAEVREKFLDQRVKFSQIDKLKQALYALHSYYIPLRIGEEDKRIDEYVNQPQIVNGHTKNGHTNGTNGKNGHSNGKLLELEKNPML